MLFVVFLDIVSGDLKGQITRLLEELIEKHPETLDAIENVRLSRLGGANNSHQNRAHQNHSSNLVGRMRQPIGSSDHSVRWRFYKNLRFIMLYINIINT